MKPKYSVIIYTPQELNHSSYLQTGLFELSHQGFIDVKVKLSTSKRFGRLVLNNDLGIVESTKQAYPKASYYKLIHNDTKKEFLFATDLYDHANQFPKFALQHCSYIFKRNYESQFVEQLPLEHQNKIYKLGLSFGVRSQYNKDKFLFYFGLILSNFKLHLKADRRLFKNVLKIYKTQQRHWNFILTTRRLKRFEDYEIPKLNNILFQTRCFSHEDHEDVKAIHRQRYHIIKLLKAYFPNTFSGGFIPSKIANAYYQDALSNVPSDPELYLNAIKKAKIVIYTRGLAHSPAWKMAEYLSQGKVIIAEHLTTELPVPLIHKKEVLFFDSDKELIENINLVLNNDALAKQLSKNARAYFTNHVHPAINVKRILDLMINKLKY